MDLSEQKERGKTRLSPEVECLFVRFPKENPHWDYGKIQGELLKQGFLVSLSSVQDVLKRHHIQTVRAYSGSNGRRHLMAH